MATVEVSFTALAAHVRTARVVASAVARHCGLADSILDEVRLAVGEACLRAVDLHRRLAPSQDVRLEIDADDGRLTIAVVDAAPDRALTGVRHPRGSSPEGLRAGGAGADDSPVPGTAGTTIAVSGTAATDPAGTGTATIGAAAADAATTGPAGTGTATIGAAAADTATTGVAAAGTATTGGRAVADPAGAPGAGLDDHLDVLSEGFGLAVIRGLVDDVVITPVTGGTGTRVAMSWPLRPVRASDSD